MGRRSDRVIGFNAFNQILAAQTAHTLYGFDSKRTVMLGFTLVSLLLAVVGYDLIHVAQRWTAYVLIAALILFSIAVFVKTPFSPALLAWGKFHTVAFLAQFFAAASYQLSWSMYVSDYSRYLPRGVGVSASFWWTYLGAAIGGAWTMLVGTVAAALYPNMELASALRSVADRMIPGFGKPLPALLRDWLGHHHLAQFLRSLTHAPERHGLIQAGRPTLAKRSDSVISAIAATVLANASSQDFVEQFGAFLAVLLYLFTPWTAINLVDFYWVRKGHYSVREIFNPRGMYGRWNWRGLLAYGVGFVAMIPFFSTPLYSGPIATALGGADIAMLVGLPVPPWCTSLRAARLIPRRIDGWRAPPTSAWIPTHHSLHARTARRSGLFRRYRCAPTRALSAGRAWS